MNHRIERLAVAWIQCRYEDLKVGDQVRLFYPDSEDPQGVFVVVTEPVQTLGWWNMQVEPRGLGEDSPKLVRVQTKNEEMKRLVDFLELVVERGCALYAEIPGMAGIAEIAEEFLRQERVVALGWQP